MKRSLSKKIIGLLLTVMMIVSVAGCGNREAFQSNGSKDNTSIQMDKEHVFKETVIDLGDTYDEIPAINCGEDKIFILTSKWEGDSGTAIKLFVTDKQGSVQSTVDLTMPEGNGWINRYALTNDGRLYALRETYFEDTSDPENYIYESNYELVCWSETGAIEWQKELEVELGEDESFYPGNLCRTNDGRILVGGDNRIVIFNDAGEQTDSFKMEVSTGSNFFVGKDGTIYFTSWDSEYTKQYLQKLNLETKQAEEVMQLAEGLSNKTFLQGTGYDFFLVDNYGVSGYNVGDTEPTLLLDYIASDIATDGLYSTYGIDENTFVSNYNDLNDYEPVISIFTKVNPEDVVEKEIIGLAGYYLDGNIKKRVIEYNKANEKYRIVITDYSKYSTSEDWEAGSNKMNSDIASGNIPDIVVMNSYEIPWDNYASKGMFLDLKELLANDEDVKLEDLCENVIEALSTDGKLYTIAPTYSIQTYAAKKSLVGDKKSWTFDEANELLATLPEGAVLLSDMTREGFLYQAMSSNMDLFVDYQNHTCSFDTPEFVKMLEMMKEYPKEIDYATYDMDENYWTEHEQAYRNDKTVLMNMSIYDFRSIKRIEVGNFGEEITFIGFPTSAENGSVLNIYQSYAISAKSDKVEGAWDFIKYFLTEDYQSTISYDLPIRKSCLEKMAQEAMNKPYYMDEETGEKVEYDDTYWLNNEEIVIPPMTQEEVDEVLEFVYSVNRKSSYNTELNNIISEEAESFFEGQKSAEDVAKIIQSRAQLFISENS